MVYPGIGALDTPRTNAGDATYLSRAPDFDVSQELSFQSPTKEGNIFDQLRNGGKPSLRTPRGGAGARAPFSNRQNLPEGIGGVEFTPLLKSATRNSARRGGIKGKENGAASAVPFSLGKIDEDDTTTPVPGAMDLSSYGVSRNASYVDSTPLPRIDSSSILSTPVVHAARGGGGDGKRDTGGPLQDGNQLSLREQENVIDRIEKENFGLKLKIHFLEEALRKAGPGFSEAALKENTELKVDKVTLQRELHRCKKLLTSAERNLENYRQEMLDLQQNAARQQADEGLRAEMEQLREELAAKDAKIEELQRQANEQQEKLRDDIEDLEADIREKDRALTQKEDELEDLHASMEARLEEYRERIAELEEKAGSSEKLEEAKETIEDLEADIRRLEQQADEVKEKLEEAVAERKRAEDDLEELQEEMANKSVHTKGLSRQVEEKLARLQSDLDKAHQECAQLEDKHTEQQREGEDLKLKLKESRQARDAAEREALSAASQLKEAQADLNMMRDQKELLQTRHDALTGESATLQRDVTRLQKAMSQLESELEQERQHGLDIERDLQMQVRDEFERLEKQAADLQTEIHEKEHLYDIDSERWETDRQHLEAERDRLQQTINRLRETEGALSGKEARLEELMDSERQRHEAEESVLRRQLESLQNQLESRQETLDGLRKELAGLREELRASQRSSQALQTKVERFEDEVEVLQTSVDQQVERTRQEKEAKEAARAECDTLRQQLRTARSGGFSTVLQQESASATSAAQDQLRRQLEEVREELAESTASVTRVTREKQGLQDQLADLNFELQRLRGSLTAAEAERDAVDEQLRLAQAQQHEGNGFRVDQERVDLRTAKVKLDSEVRRLREENRSLVEQCGALEKTLEEELEKAATEEERLGQEIRHLQSMRVRASAAESQELQAARRTVRDLEQRIASLEAAAAAAATTTTPAPAAGADHDSDNNTTSSELSMLRRDLSAARANERAYAQREAAHKEAVKTLRRQISDLERAAHEAEMQRLLGSPSVTEDMDAAKKATTASAAEIAQLREQLAAAHQSGRELKRMLREAEAESAASAAELETRIREVEEERTVLEQALDEAQEAAAAATAAHEAALQKAQARLERYRHERDELALALADAQHSGGPGSASGSSGELGREERSNLHAMLRKTQVEAEALEHELREQRAAADEAAAEGAALRAKLERARSERAGFRAEAGRLQDEVEALQRTARTAKAALHYGSGGGVEDAVAGDTQQLVVLAAARQSSSNGGDQADTDALVRAAEAQSIRHRRELRGLSMQIEWMQARWEREARLRNGAVLGKQLVAQDLGMRVACNKADLQMLQGILQQLGVRVPVLASTAPSDGMAGGAGADASADADADVVVTRGAVARSAHRRLRRVVVAVQFAVRVRRAAAAWTRHEATRQRLAAAAEEARKAERMQQLRAAWREQQGRERAAQR